MSKPIVWTIGGSDSSGRAGMQADSQTMQSLNVHHCSIISAVTAQNSQNILSIYYLSSEQIQAQLSALIHTFPPLAIKIGMLGKLETIKLLTQYFNSYTGKIILDPVMIASSGRNLFDIDLKSYIQQLIKLFPYIYLLTPNLPEAEAILNCKIHTYQDMKHAAHELLSLGAKNVVLKGGHFTHDERSHDYWTNGEESFWLSGPRYEQKNYRGSGCIYSSAITASLALGYGLKDALVIAKMYVNRGIRLANHYTDDCAFIYHANWPDEVIDLPYLVDDPIKICPLKFNSSDLEDIGLYPVVDTSDWLKKLLPLGVKTIQLRIKNKTGVQLENEIKYSIEIAKRYHAKLFINDYWELAIEHAAYGVHLGQEDLKSTDIHKIYTAGLRLGISTHCFHEVARAHAHHPSYIACGPIFHTNSKMMPFMPQGLERLHFWRRLLSSYSIVAIGGINQENINDVIQTGANGIALISAITHATNPEQATLDMLNKIEMF